MDTRKSDDRRSGECIVLIDDDPIILQSIGELLQSRGYEVHVAHDGLEGLQAVRRLRPTYVILDIVLPKIDGSRVCWLIRQDPRVRDVLIIAFSGLGPDQIGKFPGLSADAYVAKGPLTIVANNILLALDYLKKEGGGSFKGGIFGYEGFRSRQLISEMILVNKNYEALVRSLDVAMLQLDEEGRILIANRKACQVLGKNEIRLIAENFSSIVPRSDRHAVDEALETLRRDRGVEVLQVVVSLSGSEVLLRISRITDDGQFAGAIVTLGPKGSGVVS